MPEPFCSLTSSGLTTVTVPCADTGKNVASPVAGSLTGFMQVFTFKP